MSIEHHAHHRTINTSRSSRIGPKTTATRQNTCNLMMDKWERLQVRCVPCQTRVYQQLNCCIHSTRLLYMLTPAMRTALPVPNKLKQQLPVHRRDNQCTPLHHRRRRCYGRTDSTRGLQPISSADQGSQ